jgi:serine/threonine-protein kinase
MLTGRRAFDADDRSRLMAQILDGDPSPLSSSRVSPALNRLVVRCLSKDPDDRWQTTHDLLRELEWLRESGSAEPNNYKDGPVRQPMLPWVLFGLAATLIALGGTVGLIRSGPGAPARGIARVLVGVSPADELMREPTRTEVVLSPDGRTLVFSAVKGGRQELYARPIDRLEATPIPGTEKSDSPFFSPDGEWLGFWSGEIARGAIGELKKVPLHGGPVMTICRTAPLFGASWSANDLIVFANSAGGLWTVSAAGGVPRPLTTIDQSRRETSHRLPYVLPGGKAVLFTIVKTLMRWDEAEIAALTLGTGARTTVIEGGADARYVSTGHVVYARSGALMAVPFNVTQLRVTGPSVGLIDGVMHAENALNITLRDTGAAQFSISASGDLAYIAGGVFPNANRSLVWVGRDGSVIGTLPVPARPYVGARLSPDGKRVAVTILGSGKTTGIWILDLDRSIFAQLTPNAEPWLAWTPDGKRVTSTSRAPMPPGLSSIAIDGSVTPEHLSPTETSRAGSWSPDGSQLAFTKFRETASTEIWIWSREKGEHRLRQSPGSTANEMYPVFSPDGHWIAYVTDESGFDEVFVQRYPGSERHQVSTQGGIQPMWARNGQEMFYTMRDGQGTKMMALSVTLGPTFSAGAPRLLFEGSYTPGSPHRNTEVTPDGQRFLMMQAIPVTAGPPLTHMILVQNWSDELRQRVPARK